MSEMAPEPAESIIERIKLLETDRSSHADELWWLYTKQLDQISAVAEDEQDEKLMGLYVASYMEILGKRKLISYQLPKDDHRRFDNWSAAFYEKTNLLPEIVVEDPRQQG